VINENGEILGVSSSEYTFETPFPLWSEQKPDLWWHATKESVQDCISKAGIQPSQVKGIGLTGQMHGLVILDEKGKVIRPSILWNDQRTQKQCEEIRSVIGKSEFIRITGNDALTGFTAPKVLWVKEEEPDNYARIKHVLLPKDYLRYKLTGKFAVDCAGGAGTVLFDLAQRDWSQDVIRALDLDPEWFPPTFEGTQITGTGAVEEGIVSISLGTSGVVFATTNSPFIEPEGRLHAFCHAVPGKWHLMGVMLSAAGSLRWFRDSFKKDFSFDELVAGAKNIPPGSEGLLFMPYLTGERTPYPDSRWIYRYYRSAYIRALYAGCA
jgi:xylulokinase